jgi:hypothetical protein
MTEGREVYRRYSVKYQNLREQEMMTSVPDPK